MQCPKCYSNFINVQILTETELDTKKKSLLYWLTIGWIVEPFVWIFWTLPKYNFEVFSPRKLKLKSKTRKMAVCQNCGHSWRVW